MYKHRLIIFLAVILLGLLGLVGRLALLQLARGERYRRDYEQSVREMHLLPAARGCIIDRHGRIFAADKACKDLCLSYPFIVRDEGWVDHQVSLIKRQEGVTAQRAKELFEQRYTQTWRLADEIAQASGVDLRPAVDKIADSVTALRRSIEQRHGHVDRIQEEIQYHPVIQEIDDAQAARLEAAINQNATVGASVRPSHKRVYPYDDLACHVIGLMGPVSAADCNRVEGGTAEERLIARRDAYEPADRIGITGVEKMCEAQLRGRRGYSIVEKVGREPNELAGEEAQNGQDVHLTLDSVLQHNLAQEMRKHGYTGAVVVMSVERGEILALVSVPTYDLNRYRLDANALFHDDVNLPLLNRAVGMRYPPGSTAKPIVALAALATGKITPQTTFICQGHLFPNDPLHLKCTGSHGPVDLNRGLMKSCNVYFFTVGEKLGPLLLCDWFRQFGLADHPGSGLGEERGGHIPTREWLDRRDNRDHWDAEARQMGIGQGSITVTPLHIANVMATIARDGKMMSPMLVVGGAGGQEPRQLPLDHEQMELVRQGMYAVVNEPGGTAYTAFHDASAEPLRVEVSGKTGTAQASPQLADLNHDGRADEVVRSGMMAWFAGFAPSNKPRIALAVVVEYTEGHGGTTAGPIAREAVRLCRELGYLKD